MDKDRIKGSAEQAKGAVKEAAGKVFGDKKPGNRRQGRQGRRQGAKRDRRIERCGAWEIKPSPSTEASHSAARRRTERPSHEKKTLHIRVLSRLELAGCECTDRCSDTVR
jgi:uncharacterized protein YjbJ (UPF0337 family)